MTVQRMVMVALVLASGCDRAFFIDDIALVGDAGGDGPVFDRCAPLGDDPLRYATITNPQIDPVTLAPAPWSWAEARAECMRRGMDLAVPNDDHELGSAPIEERPYWVGLSSDGTSWFALDGCPAVTLPVAGMQCGFVASADQLAGADCSGKVNALEGEPEVVLAALCETPRPTVESCAQAPDEPTYELSDAPMSYADAREHCAQLGGHVAVIDSFAELHHLAALAAAEAYPSVWIGATFDSRTWQSDTACPSLFSWADGAPVFGPETTCVATTMHTDPGGGASSLAGMSPTRCDDTATRALCELD